MRTTLVVLAAVTWAFVGCRGCDQVQKVNPLIRVAPPEVDFGKVKVAQSATSQLTVFSEAKAGLLVGPVSVEGAGAAAYAVVNSPSSVDLLSSAPLSVRFTPSAVAAFEAELVVASNDPQHLATRVPLHGEGAMPVMTVTPECAASSHCTGTATVVPPALDFGAEPFSRLLPIPATALPSVSVVNEGEVALTVSRLAIEGSDATAFTFPGFGSLPAGGLVLDAGNGFNLAIRFKPTSELQAAYQAELVVGSDDPDHAEVRVALKGTLRDNLPPVVCANIVQVKPSDGSGTVSYASKASWVPLLVAPDGGYDFSDTREITPGSDVAFSATSDTADLTACTADPEDGRTGLTYLWELMASPPGAVAPALGGAATPQASLRPFATGPYRVRLTAGDTQGHLTKVELEFVVRIREDLVAQLSWTDTPGVDLDVHLVRPSSATVGAPFSGVFSWFSEGTAGRTSGDINGFANGLKSQPGSIYDFNWGDDGTADDPRLNLDEKGSGALVENVSLNYPENDPLCDGGPCTYKILVHYFHDARQVGSPPPCTVGGACGDGDACGCGSGARCVANDAPAGAVPAGAGRCFTPPAPTVRVFLRGAALPARVIPLDSLSPPDSLVVPAPCQTLYVADVVWPERGAPTDGGPLADGGSSAPRVVVRGADGTGRVTAPEVARFGVRQASSLQCSPNDSSSGVAWYVEAP